MTRTNFGPGQGLPRWTQPTLGSKPSPVGIDTSTRRVEPQFKATGTGLRVRLLRPQAHSRRHPSDFRSKRVGAPAGDLDGLMNPLAYTSTTFSSSTTTTTNNLIVINSKS